MGFNVRSWHKADMLNALTNVRFWEQDHGILDIVAEDPEEEHVQPQMQPASMHEHRGEHGRPGRYGGKLGAELRLTEEAGRDHSELENSDLPLLFSKGDLPEKDKDTDSNDRPCDHRRANARIVVGDGEHAL